MHDYISSTLLTLEEKIKRLDQNDRRLLDEIANHLLMTHELLQNHRNCRENFNQAPDFWADDREQLDFLEKDHQQQIHPSGDWNPESRSQNPE